MEKKKHKRPAASVAQMGLVLVLLFCSFHTSVASAAEWVCNCDRQLCSAFNDAVSDTAQPITLDKIYPKLTAIIPENQNLIWENDVVGSRVLVIIYSWGLNPDPGRLPNPNYELKTNKWVTVAPELYNFFKEHTFTNTRIEQLLGLPPCYGNTKIIEVFVSPADMFRPSPDPETTDQTASLEFPWRTSQIVTYDANRTIYDDFCDSSPCFSDYETWYTNRRAGVYTANPPYPWTGLGYTYDWKLSSACWIDSNHQKRLGDPPCHVGLSEFVVTPTTVSVLRMSEASDYFQPHRQKLTILKTGSGKVTSNRPGINCGKDCSGSFNRYSRVKLTATSTRSTKFKEWGGACAYAGSKQFCNVTMVNNKSVSAVFISR